MDADFNLETGPVSTYTKPNTMVKYINSKSNHLKCIIEQILKGTESILSRTSSSMEIFEIGVQKNEFQLSVESSIED